MSLSSWSGRLDIGVVTLVVVAACGSTGGGGGSSACSDSKAKSATSASDYGGLDALIVAAKSEGKLNVIALPRDWANYGALLDGFKAKYGIDITSDNPDG